MRLNCTQDSFDEDTPTNESITAGDLSLQCTHIPYLKIRLRVSHYCAIIDFIQSCRGYLSSGLLSCPQRRNEIIPLQQFIPPTDAGQEKLRTLSTS